MIDEGLMQICQAEMAAQPRDARYGKKQRKKKPHAKQAQMRAKS